MTRLELFFQSHPNLKRIDVAREAGVARQHLVRVAAGRQEPRRVLMASVISALRRLTLEQVDAEDVFELVTEQSGAWRRQRGSLLDQRVAIDSLVIEWIDENCTGASDDQWRARLASRPDIVSESLIRALVLRGRHQIDTDPLRAAALARFAISVANRLENPSSFSVQLRGCAEVLYANSLRSLGEYSEAIEAIDRGEGDLTNDVLSANDLAQAWYVRAIVLWKRGDFDAAKLFARRAAILFEVLGDLRRVAYTNVLEASIAFERGEPALARDLLLRVLGPLKRAEDKRGLAAAWHSLGTAEGQLGNIGEAKRWLSLASRSFERLRIKPEVIRARWCLGYFIAIHEDRATGLDLMRAARAAFERLAMAAEAAFVGLDLVEILLLEQEGTSEAAEACKALYFTFRRIGVQPAAEKALAYLRDATARRQATPALAKSVRTFIQAVDRDPSQEFRPEEMPQ